MSSFLYKRGEVYLIQEHPGIGSEIKKTRPWLILGVDPLNRARSTIIASPCSTQAKPIPRLSIPILLNNTPSCIVLDQLRAMDKSRFIRLEGSLTTHEMEQVEEGLRWILLL